MGKNSSMSSQFPIAILNGTSSFLSLQWCKRIKTCPEDTIIGFVPEVAVKNYLIKITASVDVNKIIYI